MKRISIWVNTTDFPSPLKHFLYFTDILSKNHNTV